MKGVAMTGRIELRDVYKGYTLDLDKEIAPEETVRRFRERLKRLDLDILERTVRIDTGRLGIPVFFSLCGRDAVKVIGTKKQMGKGGTPAQAEASAVMELAERFSFFSFCKDPSNFFTARYGDLSGSKVLPFEAVAKSVHDEGEDQTVAREVFSMVPLNWTRAYNLTRGEEVLIPFSWFFAINEFNGPSAGNCREEAILQGICEVIERHVSSIISRQRLVTPAIDPGTVKDPLVKELLGKYRRAGVRLFITDFTLDTGIPSVGVLAYDPATFPDKSEIVWTAGTTTSPEKSLSRALTEVAQLAGDFCTSSNYVASGLPKFASLEEASFVTSGGKSVSIKDLPDLSNDNMRLEVEGCLAALSSIGMEVLLVDVTHKDLAVPAFYTIIPGAHFRERAAGTSVGMFSARLIAEDQDPSKAMEMLQRINKIMPGRYYVKFYLAMTHLRLNEPDRAVSMLDEALSLDPKEEDLASIYSYMAQAYKDKGEYKRAIEALESAKRYDSERTDVYNLMGYCYFKEKEHEKAIECFRKVLKLNPSSAIDYANIASNYRELGDRDQAIANYRLALELDPSIDFARENLAKLEDSALVDERP
jgi:ribosomal protein S12 methylthiotransferase accessory factor